MTGDVEGAEPMRRFEYLFSVSRLWLFRGPMKHFSSGHLGHSSEFDASFPSIVTAASAARTASARKPAV